MRHRGEDSICLMRRCVENAAQISATMGKLHQVTHRGEAAQISCRGRDNADLLCNCKGEAVEVRHSGKTPPALCAAVQEHVSK